jgi:hypothetical protein
MLGIYDFVYAYCAVVYTDSGFCLEKKERPILLMEVIHP